MPVEYIRRYRLLWNQRFRPGLDGAFTHLYARLSAIPWQLLGYRRFHDSFLWRKCLEWNLRIRGWSQVIRKWESRQRQEQAIMLQTNFLQHYQLHLGLLATLPQHDHPSQLPFLKHPKKRDWLKRSYGWFRALGEQVSSYSGLEWAIE